MKLLAINHANRFTFQYGSIKTGANQVYQSIFKFTFQYGSIKTQRMPR